MSTYNIIISTDNISVDIIENYNLWDNLITIIRYIYDFKMDVLYFISFLSLILSINIYSKYLSVVIIIDKKDKYTHIKFW